MLPIKYILILSMMVCLGLAGSVNGQSWVNDPNDCPVEYQSQTCTGVDVVCGASGGITYCYDPASINAPGSNATSNTDQTGGFDGGYLINCYSYDGGEPHCDNSGSYWCDRNSTCYTTTHRDTICLLNLFGSSLCGNCRSGYDDCNADGGDCEIQEMVTNCEAGANNRYNTTCGCICDSGYLDCDAGGVNATNGCEIQVGASCGSGTGTYAAGQCQGGTGNCTASGSNLDCDNDDGDGNLVTCNGGNGCEITSGGSCTVGSISGTYSGCTCVVDKSYFETGTFIEYQTNGSQFGMMWFRNYNITGNLINASSSYNNLSWVINASGCIIWMDGTSTCTNPTGGGGTYDLNISNGTANEVITDSENLTIQGGTGIIAQLIGDVFTIVSTIIDTMWSINTDHFINNTGTLELNFTTINDTIDQREVDTWNTTEEMQDACGAMDGGTETRISVTYDDGSDQINYVVDDMNDDDPEAGDVTWSDLTDEGTHTDTKWCTYDSGSGFINCNIEPVIDTDTYNTSAEMRAAVNNSGQYNISINHSNVLNHPADIDTDSNLTEDDVEAYIFDNDNTVSLNLSGYNITVDRICLIANCSTYVNATGYYHSSGGFLIWNGTHSIWR